jgi:hypothetical protein
MMRLIRQKTKAMTGFAIAVVVGVTGLGLGAIAYDLLLAPERRGPTKMPSDVHTARLCPGVDIEVHDMQEHLRAWEATGEPYRRTVKGSCSGDPPDGVVYVRLCSQGGRCDLGERMGQATTHERDGRVVSATIWVRDRFERQPPHVWHELGHAFGYGIEPRDDGSDGHDEHVGRVMSADAGWSWEGLKR